MTGVHSPIGGSTLYRIRACPGSVKACEGKTDKGSPYAAEGTVAHAVLEQCLRNGHKAERFLGEVRQEDGFDIEVTEDMVEAVQSAADHIRGLHNKTDQVFIEHRFDLSHIYPDAGGTADVVLYKKRAKKLVVIDYKHGRGVPVEVERNDQLMFYGLGAVLSLPKISVKKVELVVVQPRCEHKDGPIRKWETTILDLVEFGGEVSELVEAVQRDDAPLHSGEHCRFCPAAATCPELLEGAMRAAKTEFTKVDNLRHAEPSEFSSDEIGEILDKADVLQLWINKVRDYGHQLAETGRPPTGYKLVAKRANRKWADEKAAETYIAGVLEIPDDVSHSRKLKTPAQMEKAVGTGRIDHLVTKESSGTNLVRETAPGQPVVPRDPKADFTPAAAD